MESFLVNVSADAEDREFIGFVLYGTFSRSRMGDCARIRQGPVIDAADENRGYIETTAAEGKAPEAVRSFALGSQWLL